ncbi:MAG TPA: VIT domain-containing protein [Gemmatimonas sp.]|nr:VIT domain-containing protein [Gemmatimonas sp.]
MSAISASSRFRLRRTRTVLLLSLLAPVALLEAQGRIIGRPCGAPPCPPNARCAMPLACGTLVRVSSATTVTLADRVLRYEVTEIFRNDGGAVAEADYVFPLPTGAAFEDLKLSINGEMVAGETMSAEKARGIYEEIVRRQRDPALVEWMGSGMLRARIFPIAPGEEKKVIVRFQSVATREGDALRVDYRRGTDPAAGRSAPMPMPMPRPMGRPASNGSYTIAEEERGETWSRFTLVYPRGDSYGTPYSPTHTLRAREDGRMNRVEARGISGDVTVLLPLRRTDVASMSVLTHAPAREPGFALITLTRPTVTGRATPRDLTFVLDVSGSMQGRKLEQAKAAGEALLATLRPIDRFRVIDFSTDVRAFRDEWADASAENLRAARRYLRELKAEGSTNISEALRTALEPRNTAGRLPLVVFVTDGEPTVGERNPDAIAAIAANSRGESRVFSIGVTTGVNAALVEQIALQGHGTAHFVRDEESVESSMSLLARRLSEPVLTDVRITANGVRLSRVLPAGPIDVFAGQDVVILARYDGSGDATVRLEGMGPNGPVTWSTRARFADDSRANPFVARLWAAQRIGWLAAEKRRNGGTRELDGEIRALGERFGIPTEFSSYLVLEPGMNMNTLTSATANAPAIRPQAIGRTQGKGAGGAVAGGRAAAASPVAVSPAPQAQDVRFEAARASALQREARSLESLDDASSSRSVRMVENRRFTLANGVWRDANYTDSMRTVRVKSFSPLYFELMKQIPSLQSVFALGDRVIVAGRRVAVELHPDGLERGDDAALAGVVRDW